MVVFVVGIGLNGKMDIVGKVRLYMGKGTKDDFPVFQVICGPDTSGLLLMAKSSSQLILELEKCYWQMVIFIK